MNSLSKQLMSQNIQPTIRCFCAASLCNFKDSFHLKVKSFGSIKSPLFRCAEAAPAYWRDLDPYWQGTGAPPMRRYFHPDGSITADVNDAVWGGHESSYTIVTGLHTNGDIREHYIRINRWPKLMVERKPDWGWALYNRLYCYTSIPDAHKEDGTGPPFPVFR
ncbi:hypothetical protein ACS0TY_026109 [Phlomoides rotata]